MLRRDKPFAQFFGYGTRRVNYLTSISERHRAVFVEVPKAGCTVVKRLLQRSEVDNDDTRLPARIHDKATSPLRSPLDLDLSANEIFGASSAYFRFSFVRNPYTRALSCYLDKIIGREGQRERCLPQLGFHLDEQPSFEEFLARVARQTPSDMDVHWCPQTYVLGHGSVSYDFLGRFESFHGDVRRVMAHLDVETPDHVLGKQTSHARNAGAKLAQYYTQGATDLVRHIYADDFNHLGYGIGLSLA